MISRARQGGSRFGSLMSRWSDRRWDVVAVSLLAAAVAVVAWGLRPIDVTASVDGNVAVDVPPVVGAEDAERPSATGDVGRRLRGGFDDRPRSATVPEPVVAPEPRRRPLGLRLVGVIGSGRANDPGGGNGRTAILERGDRQYVRGAGESVPTSAGRAVVRRIEPDRVLLDVGDDSRWVTMRRPTEGFDEGLIRSTPGDEPRRPITRRTSSAIRPSTRRVRPRRTLSLTPEQRLERQRAAGDDPTVFLKIPPR